MDLVSTITTSHSSHQLNVLRFLSSSFEHYITLDRVHPTRAYNYAKRNLYNLPVIDAIRHAPKCKMGDSWLYVAIPVDSRLDTLRQDEKLYVGAQTQDRMFRGDGLSGDNYHHNEMRKGNGEEDNPVAYLRTGRKIEIHRISASAIAEAVRKTSDLTFLEPLLHQPRTARTHTGYWFEQYILYAEPQDWRWNTAAANKAVAQILTAEPKPVSHTTVSSGG